jgi:cytosine/adenosine deaminase-related metal-dependent hydrolase
MVSTWAADTLRLSDRGRLRVGLSADLAVIPAVTDSASASLLRCRRSEVDLVVRRGVPVVGAPALLAAFTARRVHAGTIEVDDAPRLVEASIAKRIARCSIQEPGVRSLD